MTTNIRDELRKRYFRREKGRAGFVSCRSRGTVEAVKAMAQGFPYEFSKAKKVVASVVAAALVISFGNFALGGGKAIADDGTVEVRFNITAPGATVTLSTGEKFTAESDDNLYQRRMQTFPSRRSPTTVPS